MKLSHVAVLLAGLSGLAGCGNQEGQSPILKSVASGMFKSGGQAGGGAAGGATPEQVAAAIDGALAGTDLPLTLAVIEDRNATAVLTRIETNGAHGTWASSDRRVIVMKAGIVTATRGLGNDLMSSETGAVAALIAGRRGGTATRVQRYLDGENHIVALRANCTVRRGGAKHVKIAEIDAQVTEMTENCTAEGRSFVNSYLVDGSGYAVQSRQWLGPETGHAVLQALRK